MPERGYELLFVDKVPFPRRPEPRRGGLPGAVPPRDRAGARAHPRPRRRRRRRLRRVCVGARVRRRARRAACPSSCTRPTRKPGHGERRSARAAPRGVGVAFEGTPLKGGRVVGMPLRREIVDLDRAALRGEAADVLRAGCRTPDAARLRRVARRAAPQRGVRRGLRGGTSSTPGWQLLHVTGERSTLPDPGVPGYAVRRYVDRMDLAFALCRPHRLARGRGDGERDQRARHPRRVRPVRRRQRRAGAQRRVGRPRRRGDPDPRCRVHRRPRARRRSCRCWRTSTGGRR